MAFLDNLTFSLFLLGFAGLVLLHAVTAIFIANKHKREIAGYMKGAAVPLFIMGLYMIVISLWGQMTWPLPRSYNILFYDPFVAFGMLLASASISMKYGIKLSYTGLLGMLFGIMTLLYGINGYSLGLTEEPLMMLVMYLFYGLSGIVFWPLTVFIDGIANAPGKRPGSAWTITFALFWIFLLIASLTAVLIAAVTLPQHLAEPP